jgi:hypothetical protein
MEQTINQYKVTQEAFIWMEFYETWTTIDLQWNQSNYKWIELNYARVKP